MWKIFCAISIFFAVARGQLNEIFSKLHPDHVIKYMTEPPISQSCIEDMTNWMEGIDRGSIWAIKMADSITKFPDGVLLGRISYPGNFDECVETTSLFFHAKHCMVQISQGHSTKYGGIPLSENNMFMRFSYGFCVPQTCTSEDLIIGIEKSLEEAGLSVSANLTENDCSTGGYRHLRPEDIGTLTFIIFLVTLALCSTAYEMIQRFVYKNEKPHQLWSSFSIYNGFNQLFRISHSSAQLKCLHGIRSLSMCWVILGHTYFSFLFMVAINNSIIPQIMKDKSSVPITNGFLSVDSFFFLSGLLVCVIFFRDIAKKGSFDVPIAFLHRYIRLTPPLAILMLIQSTIISRIGNGPFWNQSIDQQEQKCRESWWTQILYVQNYIEPTSTCLGQSWYLSADMQMFWLSPLILYPILWFPKIAPFFIATLALGAAFIDFGVAVANDFLPSFGLGFLSNPMDQFTNEYVTFHTRMAPWLIGLGTGYIICGLQAKKIRLKLSKMWVVIGWAVCFGLLGGSLFGVLRFFDKEFTTVEGAFYLAFHRVGWALGMSWVVIACVAGYGGPINTFLSLDIFQPIAKLSYCNFLIHMTVQNYRTNTSRINFYLGHFEIVYFYFADLVISHLISIPAVLLFEFPFMQIDRYFLQNKKIFPLPRPKGKKLVQDESVKAVEVEKAEKPEKISVEGDTGKVNPMFSIS